MKQIKYGLENVYLKILLLVSWIYSICCLESPTENLRAMKIAEMVANLLMRFTLTLVYIVCKL